ncbi:DUF5683 domain-containing protein [Algoriphagus vanfongensis]|uniref:DUF5683 domain-containing protein n=1 Tax=Algoriphagus vanfongensis TaxID=426371 RepID=UPI00041FCAFC|nr:DUF5683 domain-containing protein [Algoriphagus vanfongensis]
MEKISRHFSLSTKAPWISLGLLFLCLMHASPVQAQEVEEAVAIENIETPSQKSEKPDYSSLPKNPRKATLLSAILPGAGQVYNGKAWKVPILYAGFITDIYFIGFNNKRYQVFREALFAFDDGEVNDFPSLNRDALVRNVEYWRKNRDLTILLLAGIYALNIIDANVDAHLSGFDISDDLALGFEPNFETLSARNQQYGFTIKLRFQ